MLWSKIEHDLEFRSFNNPVKFISLRSDANINQYHDNETTLINFAVPQNCVLLFGIRYMFVCRQIQSGKIRNDSEKWKTSFPPPLWSASDPAGSRLLPGRFFLSSATPPIFIPIAVFLRCYLPTRSRPSFIPSFPLHLEASIKPRGPDSSPDLHSTLTMFPSRSSTSPGRLIFPGEIGFRVGTPPAREEGNFFP